MAIAWYIVPYKIRQDHRVLGVRPRYVAMDDYTDQIYGAGGRWAETEILGDRAIVKLRAPANLIALADTKFKRLPKDRLDDSLSDLPQAVKQALKNEILDQGYTIQEVQDKFGDNLGNYTLRDVLKFMATRRKRPRYDEQADEIVLDGPDRNCRPLENVDAEVHE